MFIATSFISLVLLVTFDQSNALVIRATNDQQLSGQTQMLPSIFRDMQSFNPQDLMNLTKPMVNHAKSMDMQFGPPPPPSKDTGKEIADLKPIFKALKELYYQEKYGSERDDLASAVRLVGQAIGKSSATGNPDLVALAIQSTFEPYNNYADNSPSQKSSNINNNAQHQSSNKNNRRQSQNRPSSMSPSLSVVIEPMDNKDAPPPEKSNLRTIGHALKDVYDREAKEDDKDKADVGQLTKALGQAIASSSRSGDPQKVAKAIETAYEDFIHDSMTEKDRNYLAEKMKNKSSNGFNSQPISINSNSRNNQ